MTDALGRRAAYFLRHVRRWTSRGKSDGRFRSRHPQRHGGDRRRYNAMRRRRQGRDRRRARRGPRPGGARDRRERPAGSARAASTAIAISSSAPRLESCAPTISTARRCRRRSAARRRSFPSPPSIAASRCAKSSRSTTRRPGPKAVIDYAFHLIISDPSEHVLGQELPALIRDGYTSFKVYMTYDLLRLDDRQMLDILAVGAARGRLCHGPCRKPRHDPVARRPAPGKRAGAAALPRRLPRPDRRGRSDQPGGRPVRNSSTCRS